MNETAPIIACFRLLHAVSNAGETDKYLNIKTLWLSVSWFQVFRPTQRAISFSSLRHASVNHQSAPLRFIDGWLISVWVIYDGVDRPKSLLHPDALRGPESPPVLRHSLPAGPSCCETANGKPHGTTHLNRLSSKNSVERARGVTRTRLYNAWPRPSENPASLALQSAVISRAFDRRRFPWRENPAGTAIEVMNEISAHNKISVGFPKIVKR